MRLTDNQRTAALVLLAGALGLAGYLYLGRRPEPEPAFSVGAGRDWLAPLDPTPPGSFGVGSGRDWLAPPDPTPPEGFSVGGRLLPRYPRY